MSSEQSARSLVHKISEYVVLLQFAVVIFGGGSLYQLVLTLRDQVKEQSSAIQQMALTLAELKGRDALHDEQIRSLQREMQLRYGMKDR